MAQHVEAMLAPGTYVLAVVNGVDRVAREIKVRSPGADLVQRIFDVDRRGTFNVRSHVLERRHVGLAPGQVVVQPQTVVTPVPYYEPQTVVIERPAPGPFIVIGGRGGYHHHRW